MTINHSNYNKVTPFRAFCQKVLPLVYDDSLSYYELLCKLLGHVNILIDNNNILADDIKTLFDYVNNYFNSLDIKNEIDNKLDQMVADGTLKMPEIPLEIDIDNNHKLFYDVKNCGLDSTNNICDTTNRNSDITMKPYISSGSLAFYDKGGNLLELGCGNFPFFKLSDLISVADGLGKIVQEEGNTIRFGNGLQISKGRLPLTIDINIANGSLFQTKNKLDSPVGFTKSFAEKPLLFAIIDGANSCWISGINKTQNSINGIRIQSATSVESFEINVDWIAIGRWSA